MSSNNHLVEIPKVFHSYSSNLPFERCIDCDMYLLEDNTEYFIEKAIRQYDGFSAQDVIFEYAICSKCAETVRNAISQKSMAAIETYFVQNIDFNKRMEVMSTNPDNPEAWIDHCLVSNREMKDSSEFQIFAQCSGKSLNLTHMPYMVSGIILEEVQELLSPETRDELNDFMGRNLGPSPELAEVLPASRIVLI